MRPDLSVRAVHLGEMRSDVYVRGNVLSMDYPAEDDRNPTPLEVLLCSLAACAANTLNLVLCRKMNARLGSIEVDARAERRSEHPTILSDIELIYRLRGEDLSAEMVEHAIRMAEDKLCPVYAMLKPGTRIVSRWQLE